MQWILDMSDIPVHSCKKAFIDYLHPSCPLSLCFLSSDVQNYCYIWCNYMHLVLHLEKPPECQHNCSGWYQTSCKQNWNIKVVIVLLLFCVPHKFCYIIHFSLITDVILVTTACTTSTNKERLKPFRTICLNVFTVCCLNQFMLQLLSGLIV